MLAAKMVSGEPDAAAILTRMAEVVGVAFQKMVARGVELQVETQILAIADDGPHCGIS